MEPSSVIAAIVYALGAVQGLVYGVILSRTKGDNRTANRLLAAILFLLSYRLIIQVMRLFGLGYYDTFYYFMLDLSWVNGALLYFYVRAQIEPGFRITKRHWIHFVPLVIQIAISIFVRIQNLYWDGTKESLSYLGYWGYHIWMNHATIYIVASMLIIGYSIAARRLLQKPLNGIVVAVDRSKWLKRIILAFQVYFSILLAVILADLVFHRLFSKEWYYYFGRFYYYPIFGGIAILTYWLGLEGFKRKDDVGLKVLPVLSDEDDKLLGSIAEQLDQKMKAENLYLDPELSLGSLAEILEVKPYLLSRCLNEWHKKKFTDYVNELRVDEVRRLLADPKKSHYTLLALAYESGFNSKSSFNRAVRKYLGVSPSQLKEKG